MRVPLPTRIPSVCLTGGGNLPPEWVATLTPESVATFSPEQVATLLRNTQAGFLAYLGVSKTPQVLTTVKVSDLENFLKKAAKRASRGTLQHLVAELRGFLRFLATTGKMRPGLESQIDTPRCYRFEQLPRALPWETVRAFLDSIPRTHRLGRRDYAMFFLIVTYGLRCSEVVSLTGTAFNE